MEISSYSEKIHYTLHRNNYSIKNVNIVGYCGIFGSRKRFIQMQNCLFKKHCISVVVDVFVLFLWENKQMIWLRDDTIETWMLTTLPLNFYVLCMASADFPVLTVERMFYRFSFFFCFSICVIVFRNSLNVDEKIFSSIQGISKLIKATITQQIWVHPSW